MPLDEEQVERAVAFLLHPSVRGSADEAKRTFLANKGLDDAAIEEAYRRAGTAAASSSSSPADPSTAAQTHGTPPSAAFVPSYSYTSILLGLGFAGAAAYSLKTILGPSISRTVDSVRSALYPPTPPREGEDDIGGQRTDTRGVTIVEIDDEVDDAHAKRGALDAESTRELVEAIRELREEVRSLGDRLDGMAVGGPRRSMGSRTCRAMESRGPSRPPWAKNIPPCRTCRYLRCLSRADPSRAYGTTSTTNRRTRTCRRPRPPWSGGQSRGKAPRSRMTKTRQSRPGMARRGPPARSFPGETSPGAGRPARSTRV